MQRRWLRCSWAMRCVIGMGSFVAVQPSARILLAQCKGGIDTGFAGAVPGRHRHRPAWLPVPAVRFAKDRRPLGVVACQQGEGGCGFGRRGWWRHGCVVGIAAIESGPAFDVLRGQDGWGCCGGA